MTAREKIGNRIKEIRKKKGISTYKLAELSGLLQQTISKIENSQHSTGLDVLEKISTALNCEIDFIEK